MWLYILGIGLVLLGLAGLFAGGIFTIVLVPLGIIVLVAAVTMGMFSRRAQARAGGSTEPSQRREAEKPLPTSQPPDPGRVPTTPEGLADARRIEQ
ncbi:MAG: hypothetical protein JOY58_15570 [Solirubrobacterales bacterium]|nr:hypothetical protein [Solirubrobacterales bacterium]MBV9049694.1 hypothetical protein [Solirubrobacterales bacterium]